MQKLSTPLSPLMLAIPASKLDVIRTPTTVTRLFHWLSTKHISIDLAMKPFCNTTNIQLVLLLIVGLISRQSGEVGQAIKVH